MTTAVTGNTTPIFKKSTDSNAVTFASGDASTKKDIVDASNTTDFPAGILVEDINVCTDDSAAVNLAFYLYNGSTAFYIGNVNVPIGSGYTTIALVKALRTLEPDLGFLTVKSGWKLQANCVATMTAAKTTTVSWKGGPY